MGWMFYGAAAFDADLSGWDVSRVERMDGMFAGTKVFDADLSNWDVSRVRDTRRMFDDAVRFDADLSNWKFDTTAGKPRLEHMLKNAWGYRGRGLVNDTALKGRACRSRSHWV